MTRTFPLTFTVLLAILTPGLSAEAKKPANKAKHDAAIEGLHELNEARTTHDTIWRGFVGPLKARG